MLCLLASEPANYKSQCFLHGSLLKKISIQKNYRVNNFDLLYLTQHRLRFFSCPDKGLVCMHVFRGILMKTIVC